MAAPSSTGTTEGVVFFGLGAVMLMGLRRRRS
jgi:MYXO-CTERM domain-containing protein